MASSQLIYTPSQFIPLAESTTQLLTGAADEMPASTGARDTAFGPDGSHPDGGSTSIVRRRRGRPRVLRPPYYCRYCARVTQLVQRSYCCKRCGRPRDPAGHTPQELRTTFVLWLQTFVWTHMANVTFPFNLSATITRHRGHVLNYMRRFMADLIYKQHDTYWFAVAEPDLSDQLHIHFLISAPLLTATEIREAWYGRYKGVAEVGAYTAGASAYTCKTLGVSDLWDQGGTNYWKKCN
jgi:hypothetical protein